MTRFDSTKLLTKGLTNAIMYNFDKYLFTIRFATVVGLSVIVRLGNWKRYIVTSEVPLPPRGYSPRKLMVCSFYPPPPLPLSISASFSRYLTHWQPNRPKPARLSILLCLSPEYFTLSNARRFYLSMGNPWESMG